MAIITLNNNSLSSVTSLPAGVGGKVLQVVNATYNTETSSSTSTFVDTGLTASITPSSTSNKVLVTVVVAGVGKDSSTTYQSIKLLRNSTDLIRLDEGGGYTGSTASNRIGAVSGTYLDSPSTTSATTYKCQFKSRQNSALVMVQDESSVSTITLMEIEA
jgi:hypothetical protein